MDRTNQTLDPSYNTGGNMKKESVVKAAVIFTVISMTVTAFAASSDQAVKQNHQMSNGSRMQGNMSQWQNLTDDQRNRLNALHQQFIDDTANTRASIVAKQEEFRAIMQTSTPDKAKLSSLTADLTTLQQQVMMKKIDMELAAKKIAPGLNMSMGFQGKGHHGMMKGCAMGSRGMGMVMGVNSMNMGEMKMHKGMPGMNNNVMSPNSGAMHPKNQIKDTTVTTDETNNKSI